MSDSRLVRGTLLLTGATMASRILGLIYIFPFVWLVGIQGQALYSYAYTPYTIILYVATLGLPLAVSKFVSKYNELGDYRTGRRLLKSGLILLSITGFLCFLIMYITAPFIANIVVDPNAETGNNFSDVVLVIRVVSTALLVVPIMSILRGYFQGFQSMGPTAVSQVVEQLFRIVFILITSFIIVEVMNGDSAVAVAFATFGAFVGGVGGLLVLVWYWFKRRDKLNKQLEESTVDHQIPLTTMYKELFAYAIPFVLVGLAIPIYMVIDTFTINNALKQVGFSQGEAENIFGTLQTIHKLIMIPVSLSTALGLTLIPTITKTFVSGKHQELQRQITQTFQLLLFLTVPAAVGLSILSYAAFGTMFPTEDVLIGGHLLGWYAPTAILFALFTATAAILQGIDKQKYAVLALFAGIALKASLNYWLIEQFAGIGAIMGTNIGYALAIAINLWVIKKYAHYSFSFIIKRTVLISILAAAMAAAVYIGKFLLSFAFPNGYEDSGFIKAVVTLIVGVGIGGMVYLVLSIRTNLLFQIMGERVRRLPFLKKTGRKQKEGS
jgi:O-antigen/teichoic acid export membrane protein